MTENSPITQTIAAAVYLVVGPEEHKKIFADNPALHFTSGDDAHGHINSSALTENQRTALFAYLYLYSKLQKLGPDALNLAQKALSIPKGIFVNLKSIISQQRIDYIHKLFKAKQRGFAEIFIEPDGFLTKMIEDVSYAEVPSEKKKLKGLKTSDYEHDGDRDGIELVKSQSTFGDLVKKYNEYAYEKMEIVRLTGSNYQVTEANLPHLHNALKEVCKVLDLHKVPPLYIESGGINAYTIGTKTPVICLGSGCLSLLTHDELLYILGHEVGHIKSGHFQYHTMAAALVGGASAIASIVTFGLSDLLTPALEIPMMAWYRKSELTADRAGLLACQNPEAAFTLLTKLAGYPLRYYSSINTKDILAQARAFEDLDSDSFNQFAKFYNIFESGHPWTIMRAKELDRWIESGRYRAVVNQRATLNRTYEECGGGNSGIGVNFGSTSKTKEEEGRKSSNTGISIKFSK